MSDQITPGPWRWQWVPLDGYKEDQPKLLGADGAEVCNFGNAETYYPTEGNPPKAADAALIAAAPELLEACSNTLETHDRGLKSLGWKELPDPPHIAVVRAAVAKAEGQSNTPKETK